MPDDRRPDADFLAYVWCPRGERQGGMEQHHKTGLRHVVAYGRAMCVTLEELHREASDG